MGNLICTCILKFQKHRHLFEILRKVLLTLHVLQGQDGFVVESGTLPLRPLVVAVQVGRRRRVFILLVLTIKQVNKSDSLKNSGLYYKHTTIVNGTSIIIGE